MNGCCISKRPYLEWYALQFWAPSCPIWTFSEVNCASCAPHNSGFLQRKPRCLEGTGIPLVSPQCTFRTLLACIQHCKVRHRTCVHPNIPSDAVYVDDTIIPVLLCTSLFIHSATPCISSLFILQSLMLLFGWLTITDVWELLEHREGTPVWKVLSSYFAPMMILYVAV